MIKTFAAWSAVASYAHTTHRLPPQRGKQCRRRVRTHNRTFTISLTHYNRGTEEDMTFIQTLGMLRV